MDATVFAAKYFGQDGKKLAEPFRSDVAVQSVILTANNGTAVNSPINPAYCATNQCASDLAKLLAGAFASVAVTLGPPFTGWPVANTYYQTDDVPFLAVKGQNINGDAVTFLENAGQIAEAFSHGYPVTMVFAQILNWIKMDLQAASVENQ